MQHIENAIVKVMPELRWRCHYLKCSRPVHCWSCIRHISKLFSLSFKHLHLPFHDTENNFFFREFSVPPIRRTFRIVK